MEESCASFDLSQIEIEREIVLKQKRDIGYVQFQYKQTTSKFLMTTKQLNKEYASVMLKADRAVGRKEAVSLLHRADSIRKRIAARDVDPTVIRCSS